MTSRSFATKLSYDSMSRYNHKNMFYFLLMISEKKINHNVYHYYTKKEKGLIYTATDEQDISLVKLLLICYVITK